MQIDQFVMASSSKFRKALLDSSRLKFTTYNPAFDESKISGEAVAVAEGRALGKAEVVAEKFSNALILGSDQVLALDGKHFGKVDGKDGAIERLKYLSGKTHQLHSAYCLVAVGTDGKKHLVHKETVTAEMVVRDLSDEEIHAYVNQTFEWQGVVGCYQYENTGINFFSEVKGDHTTVIGLPVIHLLGKLRELGINPLTNPDGPWEIDVNE